MRKLVAVLLSMLLLVHAAIAGAADPCCVEDCPASAACVEGMCTACATLGLMAPEQASKVAAPDQADSGRQDHPAPEPVHRVWTPPD
jgi:hypothetical protein